MKPDYLNLNTIKSPNQALHWWLVHSWLYYKHGTALLEDFEYDLLCKWINASYLQIDSKHKNLFDLNSSANTGFYISEYPRIVEGSAKRILRLHETCVHRNKLSKKYDI